jgi:hypothetical protein
MFELALDEMHRRYRVEGSIGLSMGLAEGVAVLDQMGITVSRRGKGSVASSHGAIGDNGEPPVLRLALHLATDNRSP